MQTGWYLVEPGAVLGYRLDPTKKKGEATKTGQRKRKRLRQTNERACWLLCAPYSPRSVWFLVRVIKTRGVQSKLCGTLTFKNLPVAVVVVSVFLHESTQHSSSSAYAGSPVSESDVLAVLYCCTWPRGLQLNPIQVLTTSGEGRMMRVRWLVMQRRVFYEHNNLSYIYVIIIIIIRVSYVYTSSTPSCADILRNTMYDAAKETWFRLSFWWRRMIPGISS